MKKRTSKGCVFCNDERHRIREVFGEGTAKIIDAENLYVLSVDTSRDAAIFNIFYCPMCGRKLEEAPSDWTKNKACRDAVLKTFGAKR